MMDTEQKSEQDEKNDMKGNATEKRDRKEKEGLKSGTASALYGKVATAFRLTPSFWSVTLSSHRALLRPRLSD